MQRAGRFARGGPSQGRPARLRPTQSASPLANGRPDVVIAFPGGKGTAHMVRIAIEANVDVWEARALVDPLPASGSGAVQNSVR